MFRFVRAATSLQVCHVIVMSHTIFSLLRKGSGTSTVCRYDQPSSHSMLMLFLMPCMESLVKTAKYKIFSKNAFHPVGHVMAQRIEKCLGRARLVDCVGHSVKFIKAYQMSAEGSNGHKFSEKSISMFEKTFAE